jgi:hypothetical protein
VACRRAAQPHLAGGAERERRAAAERVRLRGPVSSRVAVPCAAPASAGAFRGKISLCSTDDCPKDYFLWTLLWSIKWVSYSDIFLGEATWVGYSKIMLLNLGHTAHEISLHKLFYYLKIDGLFRNFFGLGHIGGYSKTID